MFDFFHLRLSSLSRKMVILIVLLSGEEGDGSLSPLGARDWVLMIPIEK